MTNSLARPVSRRAAFSIATSAMLGSLGCQRAFYPPLERALGGRVGVGVWRSTASVLSGNRLDERFAMASTFKWALAAAVLAEVDRGRLALDQRVPIAEHDLLEYAPTVRARLAEGALSIAALCEAAVTVSDNSAANLLLDRVGGPAGWTRFARAAGDDVSRLDRVEPELNSNLPGDPRDTTTPRAMAALLANVLTSDRVLRAESRAKLREWMMESRTGRRRLRAGLPPQWIAGDKTGTGARGAVNDVLFADTRGPAGLLVIACYASDSRAPLAQIEDAHRQIGSRISADVTRSRR